MNKTITAVAALLLIGSLQQVDAQQRRRNTTRRTTPTTQRQTTPAPKVIKEVAFYDINVSDFSLTKDGIYVVESGQNNAIYKIDSQTGDLIVVEPGLANVYEGRRPFIFHYYLMGNRFLFSTSDYISIQGDDGLYVKYPEWERVMFCSNKYAFIYRHDNGYDLVSAQTGKPVYRDVTVNGRADHSGFVVDDNGSVWWAGRYGSAIGAFRMATDKQTTFYTLSKETYVANEGISEIDWMRAIDNNIYVSCHRRVYRMNMLQPSKWEEYCKVPPTLDYSFSQIFPDHKGNILAYKDSGWKECVRFFRVGAFDQPQLLGKEKYIETGMSQYAWSKIYIRESSVAIGLDKVLVDANNNYIISHGDGIRIYNPDGVVGYEKAVGKIIKP